MGLALQVDRAAVVTFVPLQAYTGNAQVDFIVAIQPSLDDRKVIDLLYLFLNFSETPGPLRKTGPSPVFQE